MHPFLCSVRTFSRGLPAFESRQRHGDILPCSRRCDMIRQMQIGKEATAMKIGFIGIGVMGESMARHLMEKGHSLTVYNRTKSKADRLLAEGAAWAESAGACAKDQDAVITIVGFPKDVEEVYLAAGGILDSARPGAYLIDMTTTSPALWQRIAGEAKQRGLRPLDA
ncbi:MAG TPA: NAD(P)-binding domain-containing protein, partial [Candidatus Limiplasma merdipullorum]|nr:NAD(P)-binding domain-containing protein [Candidatus Limiplasma merdipullorum]